MSLTIKGDKQYLKWMDQAVRSVPKLVGGTLLKGAKEAQAEVRNRWELMKARDSGTLINQVAIDSSKLPYEVDVYSPTEYSPHVELGTFRMPGRPAFGLTRDSMERRMGVLFLNMLDKLIK